MQGQSHLRKNSGISGFTSETDFNDPGVTRTESQTALSKLFRLTQPFAKRKGRTAKLFVLPARLLLFLIIHPYEKEAKRLLFIFISHILYSLSENINILAIKLLIIISVYRIAYLRHKLIIKIEIMQDAETHSEHFSRAEQMTDICL